MTTKSDRLDELAEILRHQAPERVDALFDRMDDMARKQRARASEPIAQAIKTAIRERDLTAYRLALETGASVDSIQRWLNGERGLSLRTAERLAEALGLVLVPRDRGTRQG